MTEILEKIDATAPGQDGWLVRYKVKRNDDHVVSVEAHCTGTAEAVAQNIGDEETLAYIRTRGAWPL